MWNSLHSAEYEYCILYYTLFVLLSFERLSNKKYDGIRYLPLVTMYFISFFSVILCKAR